MNTFATASNPLLKHDALYDVPAFGNVNLLHFTDCHAQLLPIYYREPSINLGTGRSQGKVPHLVGAPLLRAYGIEAGSRNAYAFSHLELEAAARTYGKVGGFAHLATLIERLKGGRCECCQDPHDPRGIGKSWLQKDALQREQLPAWFAAVQQIGNPAIAAYLQAMLLTGARPGELLALRWEDVNMAWRGLTIHDKVEGERVIPLTRYVHNLIAGLPKRGEWVFAGAGEEALTRPAKNLANACTVAGVDHVSLHGLRRSFKSVTGWLEIPAGVVAQLMGYKPNATAEKHYTVLPLDLLRVHHDKIEAWILEQARVTFDAKVAPGTLRVVAR